MFILHYLYSKRVNTLISTHSWSFRYPDCASLSFKVGEYHEVIENDSFLFSTILGSTHISEVQSG